MSTEKTEDALVLEALKEIGATGGTDMAVLMCQLIQANYTGYAKTTQALMNSYQDQIRELETRLTTIHNLVVGRFTGPSMPTPDAVMACLYPTEQQLREFGRSPGPK